MADNESDGVPGDSWYKIPFDHKFMKKTNGRGVLHFNGHPSFYDDESGCLPVKHQTGSVSKDIRAIYRNIGNMIGEDWMNIRDTFIDEDRVLHQTPDGKSLVSVDRYIHNRTPHETFYEHFKIKPESKPIKPLFGNLIKRDRFFNFKLSSDCFFDEPIQLPQELKDRLPKDYVEFLSKYKKVVPNNKEGISIKVGELDTAISVLRYRDIDHAKGIYPDCYIPIADDLLSYCFFMSLRPEDFGNVYHMELYCWQCEVLHESEEKQIEAIKKYAVPVAKSFKEFAKKIYVEEI